MMMIDIGITSCLTARFREAGTQESQRDEQFVKPYNRRSQTKRLIQIGWLKLIPILSVFGCFSCMENNLVC